MRRLLVHFLLMIITFAIGLGADWLFSERQVDCNRPPLENPVLVTPKVVESQPPAVLASPVATPTPVLIFDYDQSRFSPEGIYYINGEIPHGFEDFNGFDLSRGEIAGQPSNYIGVQTLANNVYSGHPAVFALVTERRLFFITSRSEEGFEYRFDGEFLRKNVQSNAGKGVSVLRGKLTKIKDGREVAERLLNFHLEHDGC